MAPFFVAGESAPPYKINSSPVLCMDIDRKRRRRGRNGGMGWIQERRWFTERITHKKEWKRLLANEKMGE